MNIKKRELTADKALNRSIVLAAVGILLCLTMLSATTWAWFGETVSSMENSFSTGNYLVRVTLSDGEGNILDGETDEDGRQLYRLEAHKRYLVTLTGEGSVSGGYCVLKYGDTTLYSEQIYTQSTESTPKQITFSFGVNTDGQFSISSCWGCYNGEPDITDGAEILLGESNGQLADGGESGV